MATPKGPLLVFYTDEECSKRLDATHTYGPCDAGQSQIYDVYIRNEGDLPYESYEIRVHGYYQVPQEKGGHVLQPTEDLQLLRTPRPHRLEPGRSAHVRLEWKPPLDCCYPLVFTVEVEGPFIISPVN